MSSLAGGRMVWQRFFTQLFGRLFERLSGRERVLLGLAGLVLLLAAFWFSWGRPLIAERAQEQALWQENSALLAWIESVGPQLAAARDLALGDAADAGEPGKALSLYARVDASLRAAGLAKAVQRLEPQGSNRVLVLLDEARLALVWPWLAQWDQGRWARVDALTLNRASQPGLVNVRLTLAQPSSGEE